MENNILKILKNGTLDSSVPSSVPGFKLTESKARRKMAHGTA